MKKYLALFFVTVLLAGCRSPGAGNAEISPETESLSVSYLSSLKITAGGEYTVTGSSAPIKVNAGNSDVVLILDGAEITAVNEPAVYIESAGSVTLTAAENSENTLACSVTSADTEDKKVSSAVYSKSPLTFSGEGKISIVSENGTGVKCKSDLSITSGSINITSLDNGAAGENIRVSGGVVNITAGSGSDNGKTHTGSFGRFRRSAGDNTPEETEEADAKGLKADVSLEISEGYITVDSSGDSLHSNKDITINTCVLNIRTGDDAVHADESIIINGGVINIEKSYEGIEAHNIEINGCDNITVKADDDGINASSGSGADTFMTGGDDSRLVINGGTIFIDSEGDGIDSNGILEINGGEITVSGPQNGGNGAADCDGAFTVNGGRLIAYGAAQMAQTPSGGSINTISVTSSFEKGTTVAVKDETGKEVITFTPEKKCENVIISDPALENGKTYTVFSGETEIGSACISGSVTYIGGRAGFGGPGGGHRDGRDFANGQPSDSDGENRFDKFKKPGGGKPPGIPDGEMPPLPPEMQTSAETS